MILLPSIASADPLALGQALSGIKQWPYLHIDIEDGNFTPNLTFGMKTVSALCGKAGSMEVDVHLMVTNPMEYLPQLAQLGVCAVSAHIEALPFPMRFLHRAHQLGMRAGLAMNIQTHWSRTEPFWPLCDHVLVMTSEPDEAGEKLYAPALDKALALAAKLPPKVGLHVDGGVQEEELQRLHEAGASAVVLGRQVFGCPDPLQQLEYLVTRYGLRKGTCGTAGMK